MGAAAGPAGARGITPPVKSVARVRGGDTLAGVVSWARGPRRGGGRRASARAVCRLRLPIQERSRYSLQGCICKEAWNPRPHDE